MEKLEYIIKELNNIKAFNKYMLKAIKDRKEFYTNNCEKLESISFEKIEKHSFLSEVLQQTENLEKIKFSSKLLKKVVKIETHAYAPELNLLHFKNHHIKTPQAKTIAEAITQIINNNSLTSLNKMIVNL